MPCRLGGSCTSSAATTAAARRTRSIAHRILDPLAGPEIEDLDATLGDGTKGLGGGLWMYRVSARFPSSNLANPGGESLAGELLPVQLPDRKEKIELTLSWQKVSGASGYRVYRSKSADAGVDELELLAEVSGGSTISYTDKGGKTMAGKMPLPPGTLGMWHAVDGARCSSSNCQLGTKRESHATVAVQDPSDASTYYLYAFGGRDDGGAYLDTFEFATVTIGTGGAQTVADFASGADTLSSPRAELGAWVMSSANSSVIRGSGTPNDVWIYLGGGATTGGTLDGNVEAGLLQAGGNLAAFVATDGFGGNLNGFGAGASNDQLYTFGGKSGASDGTSASLCDGGGGCAALPDLKPGSWNALGSATTRRIHMGATQESAFFFLAGGHDGKPTRSRRPSRRCSEERAMNQHPHRARHLSNRFLLVSALIAGPCALARAQSAAPQPVAPPPAASIEAGDTQAAPAAVTPPATAPAPAAQPEATPEAVEPERDSDNAQNPLASRANIGFVLGGKVGGGLGKPWSDFGATPLFELELGYMLPLGNPIGRSIELFVTGQFSQPGIDGKASKADTRLPGDGILHYEITQQELALSLGALYRFDLHSKMLMPYGGLGGRMYLLKSKVKASAGGESYGDNDETQTKFGLVLLGGVDIFVGPGALLAELSFGWAPLDGYVLRNTNLGALSLAVGYRLMF